MTDKPDTRESAPRIDVFRRTMLAVIDRLAELGPDVEDVHDLAYNRNRAANQAKVSGGSRDYALDTHGDMEARRLYTEVAAELLGVARSAESALKKLRTHLNSEERAIRYDGTANVTALELLQARTARARRAARGEHHPHRNVSELDRKIHLDPVTELEHLRTAFRRIAARLDAEHKACRGEDGKRIPKWLDRSMLSPAQRDAVDRSLIDPKQVAAS